MINQVQLTDLIHEESIVWQIMIIFQGIVVLSNVIDLADYREFYLDQSLIDIFGFKQTNYAGEAKACSKHVVAQSER